MTETEPGVMRVIWGPFFRVLMCVNWCKTETEPGVMRMIWGPVVVSLMCMRTVLSDTCVLIEM